MTLSSHLDEAAEAGIIKSEQVERLRAFLADRLGGSDDTADGAAGTDGVNDVEAVRFARGFHDIFLTIGIVLLLIGVTFASGLGAGTLGAFAGAAAAWGLAEYYSAHRRLVLPSMALALGFVGLSGFGAAALVEALIRAVTEGAFVLPDVDDVDATRTWFLLYAGAAGLAAAILFYVRFRLPFAASLIVLTATLTLAMLLDLSAPVASLDALLPLLLIAGLTAFCAAMVFDTSDPGRRTARADHAFWLHLAAAPLIVHSLIGLVRGGHAFEFGQTGALTVIAVVGLLALVALIIDRRAILVAGLAYLGVAIGQVIGEAELESGTIVAVTLLLLGAAVVLLGTGWHGARRAVVAGLVPDALKRRLPPLTAGSS